MTFRPFRRPRPETPAPAAPAPVPAPAPPVAPPHPVDLVVEAAHIALHSCWATPGAPAPTGHGCEGCVPDLRPIVAPLLKHVEAGRTVPTWDLVAAARALHNGWSGAPIPADSHDACQDCMNDVSVIIAALPQPSPETVAA